MHVGLVPHSKRDRLHASYSLRLIRRMPYQHLFALGVQSWCGTGVEGCILRFVSALYSVQVVIELTPSFAAPALPHALLDCAAALRAMASMCPSLPSTVHVIWHHHTPSIQV